MDWSVILDDDGDSEFVPIRKKALPAVKLAALGLLIRVAREVDGVSASYTLPETLTATSSSLGLGVLASRGATV